MTLADGDGEWHWLYRRVRRQNNHESQPWPGFLRFLDEWPGQHRCGYWVFSLLNWRLRWQPLLGQTLGFPSQAWWLLWDHPVLPEAHRTPQPVAPWRRGQNGALWCPPWEEQIPILFLLPLFFPLRWCSHPLPSVLKPVFVCFWRHRG